MPMAYKEIPPCLLVAQLFVSQDHLYGIQPEHLAVAKGAGAGLLFLELWTLHHLQCRLEQHLGQFLFQESITSLVQRYLYGVCTVGCRVSGYIANLFTCLPDGTVGSPHSKTFFSSVSKSPFPVCLLQ
jgi:hypothetical protein